jgi:hypothetical protein
VSVRRAACIEKSVPTLPGITAMVRFESVGAGFIYKPSVSILGCGEHSTVRWRMRGVAYACARVGLGSGVSSDRAGAGAENTDALFQPMQ